MRDAFGYVLFAVVAIAAIVAVISLRGERYSQIGRGGLFEDDPERGGGVQESPAVRHDEIRQMLEARNARRARRGEAPLDVGAELERLTRPAVDSDLEAEIRQLVEARNARRLRRGEPALDVEAEVRKQLDDLMG